MDEAIQKTTVSLGVGGEIELEQDAADLPKRARVHLDLWADYDNIKHKFLPRGGVQEIVILTVDKATFTIVDVEEKEADPELPLETPDVDNVTPIREGDEG